MRRLNCKTEYDKNRVFEQFYVYTHAKCEL